MQGGVTHEIYMRERDVVSTASLIPTRFLDLVVKNAPSQTEIHKTKAGTQCLQYQMFILLPIPQLKANLSTNFIDAPLEVVLDVLPESSPVYSMLKGSKEMAFKEYLKCYPNAISWKTIAECLYRCGKDDMLDKLFEFIKSPEGRKKCCISELPTYQRVGRLSM